VNAISYATYHVIRHFGKLDSLVKYCLFHYFCTSFYGRELWHLCSRKLIDFCCTRNKSIRRSSWNLPYNIHCYILPIFCECLSLFDKVGRRIVNFIREWSTNTNTTVLIRYLVPPTVSFTKSCFRHKLNCMHWLQHSIDDIVNSRLPVTLLYCSKYSDEQRHWWI